MPANIITLEDLQQIKVEIVQEIRNILNEQKNSGTSSWIKSAALCKMLNISPGTLQTLRKKNEIPFKKINGTYYYNPDEINKLISSK